MEEVTKEEMVIQKPFGQIKLSRKHEAGAKLMITFNGISDEVDEPEWFFEKFTVTIEERNKVFSELQAHTSKPVTRIRIAIDPDAYQAFKKAWRERTGFKLIHGGTIVYYQDWTNNVWAPSPTLYEIFSPSQLTNLYRYCEANKLFTEHSRVVKDYDEVTLTDKVITLTPELFQAGVNYLSEQPRNEEVMNRDQVIADLFTAKLHVDEDGSFSTCPYWCDDCTWQAHIKAEYLDDYVRSSARTFVVYGRTKDYTYYRPSAEILDYLAKKHASEVEARLSQIEQKLHKLPA